MTYAGDVSPADTWRILRENTDAQLVDVRTRAEWSFVGLPDLADAEKEPILEQWQSYPEMSVNTDFAASVSLELGKRDVGKDAPVFFLCRSGVRSTAAAKAMTAVGYVNSFNVSDGFEGNPDELGHRGTVGGWKASGLPWKQN